MTWLSPLGAFVLGALLGLWLGWVRGHHVGYHDGWRAGFNKGTEGPLFVRRGGAS